MTPPTREFTIKQNDTYSEVVTLVGRNGAVQDLTGSDVITLFVRERGSTSVVVERQLSVFGAATNGQVTLELDVSDTADAGTYEVEIEVRFTDGQVITFPDGPRERGYLVLYIVDDIADPTP